MKQSSSGWPNISGAKKTEGADMKTKYTSSEWPNMLGAKKKRENGGRRKENIRSLHGPTYRAHIKRGPFPEKDGRSDTQRIYSSPPVPTCSTPPVRS